MIGCAERQTFRRDHSYNVDRIAKYLAHGSGRHRALAKRLLDEAAAGRLESFAASARSKKLYELPLGWPSVPPILR
jgi:hypothetical protein